MKTSKLNHHGMITMIILLLLCWSVTSKGYGQHDPELTKQYPKAQKEVKALIDQIESNIRNNQVDELIELHAYGPNSQSSILAVKDRGPQKMRTSSGMFWAK